MRVLTALAALWISAATAAQWSLNHFAGPLLVHDVDGDGRDDFLVLDRFGGIHSWLVDGSANAGPVLSKGEVGSINVHGRLDRPIVHDGRVAILRDDAYLEVMVLEVCTVLANGATGTVSPVVIGRETPHASIGQAQVAPLGRDIDGDGRRDFLVSWTEIEPVTQKLSWYARAVGLSQQEAVVALEVPQGAPAETVFLDLHPVLSVSGQAGEYLASFSAGQRNTLGGFGFSMIRGGVTQGGGSWFSGWPTLISGEVHPDLALTAPGGYSPARGFDSVLVKFGDGRSFFHLPDGLEPYVNASGLLLHTSPGGLHLPDAVADYDGDGGQELVWVEPGPSGLPTKIIIADPWTSRAYIQVVHLDPHGTGWLTVLEGATGDFDGDGAPDLLLLGTQGTGLNSLVIAILLRNTNRRHSRAPLRVWQ